MSSKINIDMVVVANSILYMLKNEAPWKYNIVSKPDTMSKENDEIMIIASGNHPFRGKETVGFLIVNDKIKDESYRRDKVIQRIYNKKKNSIDILYLVTDRIKKGAKIAGNALNKRIKDLNSDDNALKIYPLLYSNFIGFHGIHTLSKTVNMEVIDEKIAMNVLDYVPKEHMEKKPLPGFLPIMFTNVGREMIWRNMVCENIMVKRTPLTNIHGDSACIFIARIDRDLFKSSE